jgi:hypothetical protein
MFTPGVLTQLSQVAGFGFNLCASVMHDCTFVWGPAHRPPSANFVDEMLDKVSIEMISVAPSALEDLIQSSASRKKLEKLDVIAYAGGMHVPGAKYEVKN